MAITHIKPSYARENRDVTFSNKSELLDLLVKAFNIDNYYSEVELARKRFLGTLAWTLQGIPKNTRTKTVIAHPLVVIDNIRVLQGKNC